MNSMAADTAPPRAAPCLDYLTTRQLAQQPPEWWNGVLGVVGFSSSPPLGTQRVPSTASMTPVLDNGGELCEVWRLSDGEQVRGGTAQYGRVQYRQCEDLLFGALSIDEASIAPGAEGLLGATEEAYRDIFALQNHTQHQHLIRIWNYLPDINGELAGDERYRHFNSARRRAFRESGRPIVGTVPAACALGSRRGSPLSIYFLAARRAPRMLENPRQTSAYDYPPQFGRHSPIFSRACLWGEPGKERLFISGTASIVGHDTRHGGDVLAQTRETLLNIATLLTEANRSAGTPRFRPEDLNYKVYVRHPHHLADIQAVLDAELPPMARRLYVQADVCRADLLVEIEATAAPA